MPGRHSPPPAGSTQTPPETLKGPKRKRVKEKRVEELQYLSDMGLGSLALSTDRPLPDKPLEDTPFPVTPPPDIPSENSPVPPPALSDNATNTGHNDSDPTAQKAIRSGIITVDGIDFHHESEAEFARLLTYYGIEWQYEPNQFP